MRAITPGPRTSAKLRQLVLRAARSAGQEPRLRAVQHAIEPREVRRNRRDDAQFALLCAATLADDSACVDVGANIGELLGQAVRVAPRGRHVAFEPVPELADRLRRRFPGVDVRAQAVADRPGTARFVHDLDQPARSSLAGQVPAPRRSRTFDVPVVRLDDAIHPDHAVSVLKIDVEGAELSVLRGARATVERHRPVVAFEHADRSGTHALAKLLSELGYTVFDMDGAGPYGAASMSAAIVAGQRWNWFARPR